MVELGSDKSVAEKLLDCWPLERPDNLRALVNEPLSGDDLARVQLSFERGRPLGSDPWTVKMTARSGVQYTMNPAAAQSSLRPPGRPKKQLLEKNGL